ncbi:hypothetical protein GGI20_001836 [Coemansia sp. BCRC 34301]|nr:hypothetical protein GGI20_001836 [Coemansia sp. BCRC 34301]
MNAFTPIRLIQPQNSEQQRAIQSLVQELQKASPQLFSNIGQPGNQQLALALPMNPAPFSSSTGATPTSQAPAPAPAPAPIPVAPSPLLPSPATLTSTLPPLFASSTPPVLPSAFTAQAAPSLSLTPAGSSSVMASAPFSFAINAIFRSTDDVNSMPTSTNLLPFGLHFDSTWSSDDSDSLGTTGLPLILLSTRTRHLIHNSHKTASKHDSATNSDIEEELSGLENAALKSSMSLVAMVVSSIIAVAALI